ncbi:MULTISPECIES: FadR/GntR family transcriptional regulator [Arhodomonas]|uniref:FadR/GntR family transcriptional regulator n=2 Tax=Ectothiorhodospiraceae TaxID=72276 RepID=UPI0003798E64|nr:FCD domain-containing protein [Arhodomonas aquaeolei]
MSTSPGVATGKEAVQAYLEERIASGELAPGDKLPTERALVEQFGLSRNTVRGVLRDLEASGKIIRFIGRGTFVTGRQPKDRVPDVPAGADASPAEVMEVRLMLEPAVAEALVTRASGADLAYMRTCLERAEAARDWRDFEKWDAALHAAMVRATRNQFLIEIFERIDEARSQAEWGKLKRASLTEERRLGYQHEHREIVGALQERDGQLARELTEKHLLHVRRNLLGY